MSERPAETPLSGAVRRMTAAVLIPHRQLDDGTLVSLLAALHNLASVTDCTYFLNRQVLCAMRQDASLVARMDGLRAKLEGALDGPARG